jgi:ABC-type antimicrobial peptide transport system permease subunit
MLTKLPRY